MVENWWHLGKELPPLIYVGSDKKRNKKSYFTLGKLGLNAWQSQHCQKLAKLSKAKLDQYLEDKYDEEKYYLPTMARAAKNEL